MFKMWGPLHIIFIISPFVVAFILYLFTRNKTIEQNRRVGITLSLIAVEILILRNAEILINRNYHFDVEILPLQICHLANFILLFAFWKRSKVLYALAFCLNLPAALASIIFANSLTHYSSLLTFRAQAYLWGHMLIVAITLWALVVGFIRISKKTFVNTVITMMILYLVSIPINILVSVLAGYPSTPANYFYTLKPESGTPLSLFYDIGKPFTVVNNIRLNPVYLVLTMIFGFVIVSIFYLIYLFIEKKTHLIKEYKSQDFA